jgi:Protein of unknown function (DUF4058)
MPSPFPGMDPYLENPAVFGNLHHDFIVLAKEALQSKLPAPFYARSNDRTWIDLAERPVKPDTRVRVAAAYQPRRLDPQVGGVAMVEAPVNEPIVIHVAHDECREAFAEIYAGRGTDRRLVTTIEVLSPTNKGRSGQGRKLYLEKQQELLNSEVHLIEIDLLRDGTHTTAVPLRELRRHAPAYDYHVCVHRFDQWGDFLVYPIGIRSPLPRIEVPLLPGDGSVPLDLQAVFNRCYDVGPYRHEVNYETDEVLPPLAREDAEWARELIAAEDQAPPSLPLPRRGREGQILSASEESG